jgi:hypothetical protein
MNRRNIFGWDLPPGCSTHDLPGNRPEDEAAEAFYDAFYEIEEAARIAFPELGDTYVEALAEWMWKKAGEAYGKGYEKGIDDAGFAREFHE